MIVSIHILCNTRCCVLTRCCERHSGELACQTLDHPVRALTSDIVLCSWTRHSRSTSLHPWPGVSMGTHEVTCDGPSVFHATESPCIESYIFEAVELKKLVIFVLAHSDTFFVPP